MQGVDESSSLHFRHDELEIMEKKFLLRTSGEIKQIQKKAETKDFIGTCNLTTQSSPCLPLTLVYIKCFQQYLAYSTCSMNMGYWLLFCWLGHTHLTFTEPLILPLTSPFNECTQKALPWNPQDFLFYSNFYGTLMEGEKGSLTRKEISHFHLTKQLKVG